MNTEKPKLSISHQHLSSFGLEGEDALERNFRIIEAMVDPEWADELEGKDRLTFGQWKKLHRSGIREIRLLTLDFEGGSMGGCGSSEISIFWSPARKVGIIVDYDIENGCYECFGTFSCPTRLRMPVDQVREVIRYRLEYTVDNDALSKLTNHVEKFIPRDEMRELWREAVGKSEWTDQVMCAFEEFYHAPPPPRSRTKRKKRPA